MTLYTLEFDEEPICTFDAENAIHAALRLSDGWFQYCSINLFRSDNRPLWNDTNAVLTVRLARSKEAADFQNELIGHLSLHECGDAGDLICYLLPVYDLTEPDECLDDVCIECRLAGN